MDSGDLEVLFFKGKNFNCHDAKSTIVAKLDSQFCPVRLIKKYFERLDYPKGVDGYFLPAVRSKLVKTLGVRKNYRVQVALPGQAISYDSCYKDFKRALTAVGENSKLYGEHSDRIGGLSAAANADIPWDEAASHGRWKPGSNVPKT